MFSKTENGGLLSLNKSSTINWIIKGLLVVVFCVILTYQLTNDNQLSVLWDSFVATLSYDKIWFLVLALIMMPINWSLEAIKWGGLINKFEVISFKNSYYAIMSGLTLGILTPARIGEYGGRVLYVKAENNWKAVITTFITSISQNLVNLTFGSCCTIAFVYYNFGLDQMLLIASLLFVSVLTLIAYTLYFHIDTLQKFFKKISIPFISKALKQHLKVLKLFSKQDLLTVSVWSLMRYLVYCSQFVLLLYFFGVEGSFAMMFLGVSTVFLIQSAIPLPPMLNVFARSEIALIVWGIFSINEIAIISSSFGLWIINLLIPAFIGLLLSMNKNVVKSFGYEK